MHNLELLTQRLGWTRSRDEEQHIADRVEATAINAAAKLIYSIHQSKQLIAFDFERQEQAFVAHLAPPANQTSDEATEDDVSIQFDDKVISLVYLSELESIHIVTRRGLVLLFHANTHDISLQGSIADGLLAAAWSPDNELLALMTSKHVLTLLTIDGDLLLEVPIEDGAEGVVPGQIMPLIRPDRDDVLEAQAGSSIDWRGDGQFFAVSMYHSTYQYRRIRVFSRHGEQTSQSWPFPAPTGGLTDDAPGLSSVLAWRPSGSVIASSHRRQVGSTQTHEIVFFERNGLRHGEFTIATHDANNRALVHVIDLAWNVDSDILAILLQDAQTNEQYVELYSQNNWKYYHKKTIRFNQSLDLESVSQVPLTTCCHFEWHPESPTTLFVLSEFGLIQTLSFTWDYCVSSTEQRWAAVVDGSQLLITPLAQTIIPPPMSFANINLQLPKSVDTASSIQSASRSSITSVTFPQPPIQETEIHSHTPAVILTSDQRIILLHDLSTVKRTPLPQSLTLTSHSSINLAACGYELNSLRLVHAQPRSWTSENRVYDIVAVNARIADGHQQNHRDDLIELTVECIDNQMEITNMFSTPIPAPHSVLRISQRINDKATYIELTDGRVFKYDLAHHNMVVNDSPSLSLFSSLPAPCPWFGVARMGGELVTIGRDRRARLFCNDTLLTPQCSSFCLMDGPSRFFAFTIVGAQHACFFLDLARTLEQSMSESARSDPHCVRMVEKGAQLVTLIQSTLTPRAVLQMPRGNLETIYPRALTLHSINQSLNQRRYDIAFHTARTNRVDLNILVDHNLTQFLADAKLVVSQIKEVDHINLLLGSLVDRDMIDEDFPNYEHGANVATATSSESGTQSLKADLDSQSVALGLAGNQSLQAQHQRTTNDRKAREAEAAKIEARMATQSTVQTGTQSQSKLNAVCLAIRAALVEADPTKYVLSIITSLVREQPPQLEGALELIKKIRDNKQSPNAHAEAESALKYAIFLVDVKSLYHVALGMYDRELALLVARHAQMDPKEYLPIIDDLFSQSVKQPMHTCYKINVHLRRWDRAIVNLIQSIDAGEVGHELFSQVIKISNDKDLWKITLAHVKGEVKDQQINPSNSEELIPSSTVANYDSSTSQGRYLQTIHAYGKHMQANRNPHEASAAFLLVRDFESALRCYQQMGDWRTAVALAYAINLPGDQIRTLAFEFVSTLRDSPAHARDAARLLLELGEELDEVVNILCEAEDWDEAAYTSESQGRRDLIASTISPRCINAVNGSIKLLIRRREKYTAAVDRLRIVRRVKLMVQLDRAGAIEGVGAINPADDIDDDLLSIVSGVSGRESSSSRSQSGESSASGMSGMSGASTASTSSIFSVAVDERRELTHEERRLARLAEKQKRKQSKKRVKEGSANEEQGLIDILREARVTESSHHRTMRTVRFLVSQGHLLIAAELQHVLEAALDIQKTQEARPMPYLEEMNEQQREALARYWDWPNAIQRQVAKVKGESDEPMRLLDTFRQEQNTNRQRANDEDEEDGLGANMFD